jgi:hypothetical protein
MNYLNSQSRRNLSDSNPNLIAKKTKLVCGEGLTRCPYIDRLSTAFPGRFSWKANIAK